VTVSSLLIVGKYPKLNYYPLILNCRLSLYKFVKRSLNSSFWYNSSFSYCNCNPSRVSQQSIALIAHSPHNPLKGSSSYFSFLWFISIDFFFSHKKRVGIFKDSLSVVVSHSVISSRISLILSLAMLPRSINCIALFLCQLSIRIWWTILVKVISFGIWVWLYSVGSSFYFSLKSFSSVFQRFLEVNQSWLIASFWSGCSYFTSYWQCWWKSRLLI